MEKDKLWSAFPTQLSSGKHQTNPVRSALSGHFFINYEASGI